MGWQDAPIVGGKKAAWESAPIIEGASLGVDPPTTRPDKSPITSLDDPRFVEARWRGEMEGGARAAPVALGILGAGALAGIAPAGAITAAKEIGIGAAADKALESLGVPTSVRYPLLAAYGFRKSGMELGRKLLGKGAAKAAPAAAKAVPIPNVPRGASTTGTPSAATIPNVRVSAGSAPVVAKAAPVAQTAAVELPEAATFYGDKVWRVGDRVFQNAKDALQHSHTLKRGGTAAKVIAEAAPSAEKAAAPTVARAVPTVAKAATSGATRQAALMNFAKEAAEKNPKLGQKIHVLLDSAGDPVRILTSDQAGAATRAGHSVTWVKNIFR